MSKTIHTLTPCCPSCGYDQIEEDYNYCSWCGHDLELYKFECPSCERRSLYMGPGPHNYCGSCGFELRGVVEFVFPSDSPTAA